VNFSRYLGLTKFPKRQLQFRPSIILWCLRRRRIPRRRYRRWSLKRWRPLVVSVCRGGVSSPPVAGRWRRRRRRGNDLEVDSSVPSVVMCWRPAPSCVVISLSIAVNSRGHVVTAPLSSHSSSTVHVTVALNIPNFRRSSSQLAHTENKKFCAQRIVLYSNSESGG